MDTITLILIILAGMSLSLLAAHLWVGIIDGIGGCFKRIFHIGRKQKKAWHTLSKDPRQESQSIRKKPSPFEE